jgi:phage baseplate assembly protein W
MVDFSSIPNFVTFESDIDIIMQQIEILFDTRNGEVLGSYDFGTRFDTYLYNPNIGNQTVAQEVQQYIISNVELFNWNVNVDVQFCWEPRTISC